MTVEVLDAVQLIIHKDFHFISLKALLGMMSKIRKPKKLIPGGENSWKNKAIKSLIKPSCFCN